MPQPANDCLWTYIAAAGFSSERCVADAQARTMLSDLEDGTTLEEDIERLRGRSILLIAKRQSAVALALAELDGIAGRIVLYPPDLAWSQAPDIIADTEVDVVLSDACEELTELGVAIARCGLPTRRTGHRPERHHASEWLLFTSGTTGRPKQAVHTLKSLTAPLKDGMAMSPDAVWSTFYDIRRYGGLQILLRAFVCGGSIVLSDAAETVGAFIARAGAAGVTHMSGTPSHWRRALMSGAAHKFSPAYVRLSGEVADQAILNQLKERFPAARIAHAYASTEAGVAFDVRDGLAGFPANLIGQSGRGVEMKVEDGTLRIRSACTALGYAGQARLKVDEEGFVDTADFIELRDGRYYFIGRREGVINVGGLKVHPEEVEAVVNLHPAVQMSRAYGRLNPITGAIVVTSIVIRPDYNEKGLSLNTIKHEILEMCRRVFPPHKVPSMLYEVPFLELSTSGKLLRPHA